MLRMITGKIGGGKTYYAVREIIDELVNGERTVVTNVELMMGALNEYIQREHPEAKVDLFKRVRILDESETLQFYLHRQHGVDVEPSTKEQERKGEFPKYPPEAFETGVFYVLDEVHTYFNCRNWMNVGLSCAWYLAQHRKFDDEIIAISQFSEQIDKQFKGFAQYWLAIVNNGNELMAGFRGAPYCVAKWYNQEKRGFLDKAQSSERYRINAKIGACYDTTAGTGIKGRRRTETRRKRKGLNPIMLVPVGVVALVAIFYLPQGLGAAVNWAVGGAMDGVKAGQSKTAETLVGSGSYQARLQEQSTDEEGDDEVEVVGMMELSGMLHLWFSDGERLALPTQLVTVAPGSVTIGSESFPMRSRYSYEGFPSEPYRPGSSGGARGGGQVVDLGKSGETWEPRRL